MGLSSNADEIGDELMLLLETVVGGLIAIIGDPYGEAMRFARSVEEIGDPDVFESTEKFS